MVERGGGGGGGGASETNKNETHWKADWVCIGLGNHSQHLLQNRWDLFMQHIYNSWEQLLYKCWIMV